MLQIAIPRLVLGTEFKGIGRCRGLGMLMRGRWKGRRWKRLLHSRPKARRDQPGAFENGRGISHGWWGICLGCHVGLGLAGKKCVNLFCEVGNEAPLMLYGCEVESQSASEKVKYTQEIPIAVRTNIIL